jgi:hypothetical protein
MSRPPAPGATAPPRRLDPEQQRWLTSNPLWKWRIANAREAREVEDMLGVPRGRVQGWETGAAAPGGAEIRKLARLTGIADLAAQWSAWMSARPPSR